jgi:hypothetical protein
VDKETVATAGRWVVVAVLAMGACILAANGKEGWGWAMFLMFMIAIW